ncbi:uncharacterized protein LOC133712470 isoform X1 [Rosa rugosa]|uniref:uncharacterized protein LOC133712470 isoform X1 n=1 Tax=Rosa rugosa TaxID=74645 RepID=UPI002B4037F1|nr:uncharacterized protein LOC133712470 isoform X1 [Rosa rugosa]
MLKHFQLGNWTMLVSPPATLPCSPKVTSFESENRRSSTCSTFKALKNVFNPRVYSSIRCAARRRVRYDDDDDGDEDEENEENNKEIALLELYSQCVRGEALIVHAMVDDQPVEVLVFKGFSSCLSYRTSPDPSKSILPARAVIESIDRVRGPFDPSNIEYLQKDLSWKVFKSNLPPNFQMYI